MKRSHANSSAAPSTSVPRPTHTSSHPEPCEACGYDEWLDMDGIAAALGGDITRDTIYKWTRKGYPSWPREAIRLPNGQWRVRRSDLTVWMQTQPWNRAGAR